MDIKPKILVVDDKPENLFAVETVLKDLNVELIKVTNGNDALKETLHHKFVLALLDIQMPGMDGFELAGILREEEQTSKLPIIFISAVYTDSSYVFQGYEKGAFSFITKPFQPEILINKVKFFVQIHQHEMALEQANKNLEEKNNQLLAINKELDSFTYTVSHDLRAPLRAINGYTQIVKKDYAEKIEPEGIVLLNRIHDNSIKMNSLIDALLDFSHLGKQEISKTDVDATDLVKQVIDDLIVTFDPDKKVKFIVEDLPIAYADYILLTQVFANLISNAIKYSSKNPTPVVTITGETKDDQTIFKIEDNGVGFNMKNADKLFGVFQRLHSATEFEGTGIGLANMHRIITRHSGKIWVEAEVNKGAKFYFSLPKKD